MMSIGKDIQIPHLNILIKTKDTAAYISRQQYKPYSAGAHLQRTGETIAPSAFSCFMAAST